ncbi:MAG: hypothetical protein F6K11_36590, partial [Leptolyngbya sp. SIO3F4]|nr:hypothetical protein [Leptolyngbya sp. SIO3F4]
MLLEQVSSKTWYRLLKRGSVPLILSSVLTFAGASIAQFSPGQRGFYCDPARPLPNATSQKAPTTIYQTVNGQHEPWIRWESSYFARSGYSPLIRCQQVSGRLEKYRQERSLAFIKSGMMNGQRVICTAATRGGQCENLIYTLRNSEDAEQVIFKLKGVLEGRANFQEPLLYESTQIPYID